MNKNRTESAVFVWVWIKEIAKNGIFTASVGEAISFPLQLNKKCRREQSLSRLRRQLPLHKGAKGYDDRHCAVAEELLPPHQSAAPTASPEGKPRDVPLHHSPHPPKRFQRSAKTRSKLNPGRHGGLASPPSSIRRASFARPRRIFAEHRLRCGSRKFIPCGLCARKLPAGNFSKTGPNPVPIQNKTDGRNPSVLF